MEPRKCKLLKMGLFLALKPVRPTADLINVAVENPNARERRRQTRSPKQANELRIGFEDFDGGQAQARGRLIDSTEEGIGVETQMPLLPGSMVEISGDIGQPRPVHARKASVRWCHVAANEGLYHCGLWLEDWTRQSAKNTAEPVRDYYEVLQVSQKADPDTIQRVFRMLAQRYHPDNRESGNEEVFKTILEAYEVLGNPERRAAYDVRHLASKRQRWRIFDQPKAAVGVEAEKRKRQGAISLLYTRRVTDPDRPTMNIQEFEDLLGCPREHLEFTLWYLKENGLVARTDNGRYSITVKGVDYAEESGIWYPEASRMLPSAPGHATV